MDNPADLPVNTDPVRLRLKSHPRYLAVARALVRGLGDLAGGSFDSRARATSSDGSVVVGRGRSASGFEAFVWDATNGMRELDQILTSLGVDLTGWTLSEARSISADGLTIVGSGKNPSGENEGWIAVIPEPSTGLLVMTGFLGLAGYRRGHVSRVGSARSGVC